MKTFIAYMGIMLFCTTHLSVSALNGGKKIDQKDQQNYCYACAIYCWNETSTLNSVECTGTIVSDIRVVTSYQCYKRIQYCKTKWIRAGVSAMADKGVKKRVLEIVDVGSRNYQQIDLVVLILKEALNLSDPTLCTADIDDTYSNIKVAYFGDDYKYNDNSLIHKDYEKMLFETEFGDPVFEVSGFGDPHSGVERADSHLRAANFTAIEYEPCDTIYSKSQNKSLARDLLCYTGAKQYLFTNVNDRGAPVVLSRNGKPVLIGVNAFTLPDPDSIVPLMETATLVTFYRDEILSNN